MATQTLTIVRDARSSPALHESTNANTHSHVPRSLSSDNLCGKRTFKPSSDLSPSALSTVVNLASRQCIHLRGSPLPQSTRTSANGPYVTSSAFDADSDDDEDAEATPPLTRPCSPNPGFDSSSSESDEDDYNWPSPSSSSSSLLQSKYTGGVELSPCFSRQVVPDEYSEEDGWNSHIPGTPAIEKDPFKWSPAAHPPSSDLSLRSTAAAEMRFHSPIDSFRYTDEDDEDFDDDDEIHPDEMDSDQFEEVHTWTNTWVWHPCPESSLAYHNPTPRPLPSIRCDIVESIDFAEHASPMWTPLQDSLLGSRLTVPCHRVYNSRHPQSVSEVPPTEGLRSEYIPSLGSSIIVVPSLKEQAALGIFSIPIQQTHNQRSKRRRSRSRVRCEIEDDFPDVVVCDPSAERGRSCARSPISADDEYWRG